MNYITYDGTQETPLTAVAQASRQFIDSTPRTTATDLKLLLACVPPNYVNQTIGQIPDGFAGSVSLKNETTCKQAVTINVDCLQIAFVEWKGCPSQSVLVFDVTQINITGDLAAGTFDINPLDPSKMTKLEVRLTLTA